jgi:hypothetical protein
MLLAKGADPNALHGRAVAHANLFGDVETFRLLTAAGGIVRAIPKRRPLTPAKISAPEMGARYGISQLAPQTSAPPARNVVAGSDCRLAILAESSMRDAAALLNAEFARLPGVELLEREEIARVLSEQQLAGAFGPNDANGLRIGELLRANALLLLRTRQVAGHAIVEARLVQVNPGLVIDAIYAPAPLPDQAEWAHHMAQRTSAQMQKCMARDAVALSLVGLRSPLSTGRGLEETMSVLLADRLSHETRIHLLDRASLDKLAEEQSLTSGPAEPFWKGRYVVDGTVETDGLKSDMVRVKIQLRPNDTAAPSLAVETVGERGKLESIVEALVSQIREALALGGTERPASAPGEAAIYLRDAQWAAACGMPERARESAEAAWHLGLRTPEAAEARARTSALLIHQVASAFTRESPFVLGTAEKLWSYAQEIDRRALSEGGPDMAQVLRLARESVDRFREMKSLRPSGKSAPADAWLTNEVASGALLAMLLCDSATARIQNEGELHALQTEFREVMNEAIAANDAPPTVDRDRPPLAELLAQTLPVWNETAEELEQSCRRLLGLNFAEQNDVQRLKLRRMLSHSTYQRYVDVRLGGFIESVGSSRPAFWRRFAATWKESPVAEDRWLGWQLSVIGETTREPRPPSDAMLAAIWDLRDILAREPLVLEEVDFFFRIGHPATADWELLDPQSRRFTQQALNFRRNLFIALSEKTTKLTWFSSLLDRDRYSAAERDQVVAAIDAYFRRIEKGGAKSVGQRRQFDALLQNGNFSDPEPPEVVFRRFWHPLDLSLGPADQFRGGGNSIVWAEERVWFYGEFGSYDKDEEPLNGFIFSIKLPSFETEAIALPVRRGSSSAANVRIAVTPGHLFASSPENGVLIYDRATKSWKVFREFCPVSNVAVQGESLYFVTGEAFMRIEAATGATTILASTRRESPTSSLDRADLRLNELKMNSDGEIEIEAFTKEPDYRRRLRTRVAYNPKDNVWREIVALSPIPKARFPEAAASGFSSTGKVVPTAVVENRAVGREMVFEQPGGEPMKMRADFEKFEETARRYPKQSASVFSPGSHWLRVPAGYLVVESMGKGFWFLPHDDLARDISERDAPLGQ